MHTVRHLSIAAAAAAALGLASCAFAQPPEPNPADTQSTQPPVATPSDTPSPQPPVATPSDAPSAQPPVAAPSDAPSTQPPASEDNDAASGAPKARDSDSVSGIPSIVGLDVLSPAGEMLGTVINVVASTTGRYAIISTGNDTATAVPYEAVAPMVHDGKVIMDRTKLQNSPQVAQGDLHDRANTKWRQQADTYWAGQAPGRIRSASPGVQPDQQPRER